MTDDEIADRVRRAPELARRLYVHPKSMANVLHVVGSVSGLDWHGVQIEEHPMVPSEAMVWVDGEGNVLKVQMPEAIAEDFQKLK